MIAALVAPWRKHAAGSIELLSRTFAVALRGGWNRREFVSQLYVIGNESLPLVFGAVSFIGMIMVAQAGLQMEKFIGNLGLVGPIIMPLYIREFAPTICGLMIATRVGAGIAAELGSMRVTEQLDALRMCNSDPVAYLVAPRFLASMVMSVVLAQCAVLFAIGAGAFVGFLAFGVNPRIFVNLSYADFGDIAVMVLKSLAYGAAVPIAASYCGMRASGGAEGVGEATTAAVVASSTSVIALDLLISLATLNL